MKTNKLAFRFGVPGTFLTLVALLLADPAEAQSRISAEPNCAGKGVGQYHFDLTLLQADYKVMVTDYEVEPDLRIRLVKNPEQADLVLADRLSPSDRTVCKSATRYRSTTMFVAKFVPQPDLIIMLNPRELHADYTLYVDSEILTDDQAAALFAVMWEQKKQVR